MGQKRGENRLDSQCNCNSLSFIARRKREVQARCRPRSISFQPRENLEVQIKMPDRDYSVGVVRLNCVIRKILYSSLSSRNARSA